MDILFAETYVINKKEIETILIPTPIEIIKDGQDGQDRQDGQDGEIECLPKLYTYTKNGNANWWQIYIRRDLFYRLGGKVGGKTRIFPPVSSLPKNIGKLNETSSHEQAIFTAKSHWNKKRDQGYSETEKTDNNKNNKNNKNNGKYIKEVQETEDEVIKPMLANKYRDRGMKYLKLPFAASRKFDGVRCTGMITTNGNDIKDGKDSKDSKVVLSSRNGKELKFMQCIRDQVYYMLKDYNKEQNGPGDFILDGELYNHNMPFNEINGMARKSANPSKFDNEIQFHIYDLISKQNNLKYQDRVVILQGMKEVHESRYSEKSESNLRFEFYDLVTDHSQVREFHDKYVNEGYEGLMLRNLDGFYLPRYRSNDLLKYKDFQDMEVEVVGASRSLSGNEKGAVIFECLYPNTEKTFTVRPRGTIAKKRWQYQNKQLYIGKMLTIRFQLTGVDDGSLPRFPVGIKFQKSIEDAEPIDFRDYE
jgi:DNA ligase-1